MDTSKGLFSDTRPQDQPPGFYPFAKNGLANNIKGALENEKGFRLTTANIPYRPIGVIESDKFPIIISTNNTNSAIGYFDDKNETYLPIYNDATLPFKFQFSTDHYVTGQAQRNSKGEVICALTDKNSNPLFINCDKPTATTLESLFLFPRALSPQLSVSQDQGGALSPGAYYILAKYTRNDGTETSYLSISDVTLLKGTAGTLTSNSLVITLNSVDTTYDSIQLAVISKVNGVTKVVQLPEQAISSGTMVQVYSGAELTTDLTLEEVLISPAVYSKVGTMGQLNDALYIGDLQKEPEINMQRYASVVKVNWVSELISVIPPTQEHITGQKKHFMHQEVYALYIQYSLTYGGWSKYFTVPGTLPLSADLATATETGQELLATGGVPKYKVEDTIHSYNTFDRTGTMGVWINENETYPDTADYDSSALGLPSLRNQKVRHHRFPSIEWCKENLYSNETEYGKTKLDLMGIRASNVIIPPEYKDIITGWRIVYAKRTINNSTVLGQSVLLHAARAANSSVDADYISTGGNWGAVMDFKNGSNDKQLNIDKTTFRFHSFDMLFNQPALSPAYMSFQLKYSRPNLAYDGGLIEDFSISPDSKNGPIVYLIDYTQKGTTPVIAPAGKRIRKVSNTTYVPVNVIAGKWKNLQQETTFGGNFSDTREVLTDSELSFSNLWVGPEYEQPDKAAQFENTFLCNLMALKNDICKPFTSQAVASAGQRQTGVSGDFFGGDCFLNDYTFHTYGWNDYDNRGYGQDLGGIKVARRIICEAVANINLRYEIPGNIYSKWYPNSPLVVQDPNNYILAFNRKQDPNQFGYNRDLSSVNEFIFGSIFNPVKDDVTVFPFRVHRLGKISRQDKRRSWRTALPLDYYEAQKDMGFIVNIDSYQDRLIIHHENAMFLSQGKTVLENGLLGITLGSGDIFASEPQEELPSKLGYAGTQHDLACVKTPIGYLFLDAKQGQMFLFNGKLTLANNGVSNFFRQFMKMKDKNTYMGNGFTIGYDPEYRRFLLTAKNQRIASPVKYDYEETQAYYATLLIGDIVYKNGRYQRFLGANTTTYQCYTPPVPHGDNKVFTIPEDTLVYTRIGTLTGTNYTKFILQQPNDGSFYIDEEDGLFVGKPLDFETKPVYNLIGITMGADNVVTTFTITVNITNVANEPPIAKDERIFIPETVTNGTDIYTVQASDPAGLPLTYTILGGNFSSAFTLNASTGHITVTNAAVVKYLIHPAFGLTISVSNGTRSTTCLVQIFVNSVPQAPTLPGGDPTLIIYSSVVAGVIGNIQVTDPNTTDNLRINTLAESVPGLFTVDTITHDVILNDATAIDPTTTPVYTMNLEAVDNTNLATPFTLTITVQYDLEDIIFEPINPFCTGTTRHWSDIKIKTATHDIATVINNPAFSMFQNIRMPYYLGALNATGCGGTDTVYFSAMRSGFAIKNDCTEPGTRGSTVKYVVPEGYYVSTVSQADANAKADNDIAVKKQQFANDYGECLR